MVVVLGCTPLIVSERGGYTVVLLAIMDGNSIETQSRGDYGGRDVKDAIEAGWCMRRLDGGGICGCLRGATFMFAQRGQQRLAGVRLMVVRRTTKLDGSFLLSFIVWCCCSLLYSEVDLYQLRSEPG